jgi:mannose-6-phosphate isomerase-like protein (cupin superfamily)
MSSPSVADVKIDSLPTMYDARGALTVAEFSKFVPFSVVRLFYVRDVPVGSVRGQHAHYRCSQYMICLDGRLGIALADGMGKRSVELSPGQAILVEPGLFVTETYRDDESALLVLCDRPYEAEDYIHGMDEFLKYRREKA